MLQKAIEEYQKAIQLDPQAHEYHMKLAKVYLKLKQSEQALQVFDKISCLLRLYEHLLELSHGRPHRMHAVNRK